MARVRNPKPTITPRYPTNGSIHIVKRSISLTVVANIDSAASNAQEVSVLCTKYGEKMPPEMSGEG